MLRHGGEPKLAALSPGAPRDLPVQSSPGGRASLPLRSAAGQWALLPEVPDPARSGAGLPKNCLNNKKTAIGEAKAAMFSTGGAGGEGQGVPDPAVASG